MTRQTVFGWSRVALLVLISLFALAGCNSVDSKYPLGEPLSAKDKLDLSGIWMQDHHPIYVKQLAGGKLRIAGLQWHDGNFEMQTLSGQLTKNQGSYYLNLRDPKRKDAPYSFSFSLVIVKDDQLLLIPPNVDAFRQAVEAGRLSGNVEHHRQSKTATTTAVHLSADTKTLNAFVKPKLASQQFELDQVSVFHRIGDAHDMQ